MYDIFYLKNPDLDLTNLNNFKKVYPLSKKIEYNGNMFDAIQIATKKSLTSMFWLVEDGSNIDGKLEELNLDKTLSYVHGGIYLISKKHNLVPEDIELLSNRQKELVSSPLELRPIGTYDIFFISYQEPNADFNWKELVYRFPKAKRIHGVTGIHRAHKEAAMQSTTENFWVVDGDSKIIETFKFDYKIPHDARDSVYIWRSINPINGLQYGYGGVKLLPKKLMLESNEGTVDMTTSIGKSVVSVPEVSNYTMFNTDPFNTWKSAFRECIKLSSKIISNQIDDESEQRLEIWCTVGTDRPNGEYAIKGAQMGREYGLKNKGNTDALKKINDWEWLKNEFNKL